MCHQQSPPGCLFSGSVADQRVKAVNHALLLDDTADFPAQSSPLQLLSARYTKYKVKPVASEREEWELPSVCVWCSDSLILWRCWKGDMCPVVS